MTVRPLVILAVFALVATLDPGAAQAQAQAESDARAQARRTSGRVRRFPARRLRRALAEYQTALELSAEPSLTLNVALVPRPREPARGGAQDVQRYLELAPTAALPRRPAATSRG